MTVMKKFASLLNFGTNTSLDFSEIQKQLFFKLFFIFAFLTNTFSAIYNLLKENIIIVFINVFHILVFALAIFLTIHEKYLFLRVVSLLLLSSIVFFAALFYDNGMEYRLLILMVPAVILFENTYKFLGYTLLMGLAFSFCRIDDFIHLGTELNIVLIKGIQIFIPFIFMYAFLFYFKKMYTKSQYHLQIALNEVSKSNQMNEKILYSLAHDLRTPLSSITSIVNILKKHDGFSADEIKWLEMIELSSSNSNAMVNQLLESNDLMKNSVELQLMDLNILLENVVMASNLIAVTKKIKIDLQKEEPNCIANVDAIKIYRLISNLMNNAIKFSYESGTIEIKVSKFTDLATISIKDYGIGISENYSQSIFDPFTKAKRKGTNNEVSFGLGLYICKQIAELHGGTIKVISQPGQGSEFVVSLPLSV